MPTQIRKEANRVRVDVWAATRRAGRKLTADQAAGFVNWVRPQNPGLKTLADWDVVYTQYMNRPVR